MRAEEGDFFVFNESFVKDFRDLDRVIKFSYAVVFGSFVVLEDDDVFDFLVPDWEVDSR